MQTLPDYHLDALFRAAMEDEAEVLASTAVGESQMLERVGQLLARRRKRRQLVTLMLAAALTTLTAAAIALGGNRLTPPVTPEQSPEASAGPAATLPPLTLPGSRSNAAGEYGWTGALGSFSGMHTVIEDSSSPDQFRQIQLTFAVEDGCFANRTDVDPVTVAGFDGLYVEPYEDPAVLFMPREGAETTTGAYALAVGDRTLCLYLTWDPGSTQDELEAARQVLESLRAQPFGPDGIRINFTLPRGWDTG